MAVVISVSIALVQTSQPKPQVHRHGASGSQQCLFSSHLVSLPIYTAWERGTCVWTTCPGSLRDSGMGRELNPGLTGHKSDALTTTPPPPQQCWTNNCKTKELTLIDAGREWAAAVELGPRGGEEILPTEWMIEPAQCGRYWVLGPRGTQVLTTTHQLALWQYTPLSSQYKPLTAITLLNILYYQRPSATDSTCIVDNTWTAPE